MALRGGFSSEIHRSASAGFGHYCRWRSRPRHHCRSLCAGQSERSRHAGGRPLLVVPDACNWLDLRSVLIAWKDTAEARRAVADALPLLRKATDVTVVEIVEEPADRTAALSPVKDVAAWLSRHGVSASAQVPEECGEAGALLERI